MRRHGVSPTHSMIPRSSFNLLRPLWLALVFVASFPLTRAEPLISEFMAANSRTLSDSDGAYSDWIEIHNPDAVTVDLTGWYLSDSASNKTKWQFPAISLPPGGYVVVFASSKNRRDPLAPLHTNFSLSASGEYLGLTKPDGVTVVSEFAPSYPPQADDVSYGFAPKQGGGFFPAAVLAQATPGTENAASSSLILSETVTFSRASGPFRNTFSLNLSGASQDQDIRYVLALGPQAATAPEPTFDSPIFNAALPISQSTLIRAAVFSRDGSRRGPVATAYFAHVNSSLATFSSQLPILVVDSLGSGPLAKDGVDHPSWIFQYAPRQSGQPSLNGTPEMVSTLTSTVRGSSSAEFPKKGYNLKFTDPNGSKREQSLLDLPAYEKWALVAPWSFDLSYVNNAFVYSLSNQMGRWAPRTRMVEVFLNAGGDDIDQSDYAGIYVVTDRIEIAKGRVDLETMLPGDVSGKALTGGYILKLDTQDPDEIGWKTQRNLPDDPHSSVVLVSPKAEDIAPAQLDYIRNYVQRMEDALVRDRDSGWGQRTYLDYIDRASWVDHHLLNTFVCNPDALVRSAYFNKPRGGRLAAGPVWDFDRALGSYWDERSFRWDVWSGLGATDVWRNGWWGILVQDPEFMQDWVDRWQSLRRNELSRSGLLTLVDSLTQNLVSAAADRDAAKWPDNRSPRGSYAEQIEEMRRWVTRRAEWIDAQFLAAPAIAASGATLTFTAPAGAQLVYTLDGSDPRSLGGEIAPNAIITSAPLTVPADANVHVRSYRADLKNVFPGSPWSSAVGGETSSPLAPVARLVNISTRALVGSGENALIAGVVVADTEGKRFLSRAVGPALAAFGASGYVPDPQLSIFSPSGSELFRNNSWETGPDAVALPALARSVGAFPLPAGSNDSALASPVSAGAYTLQISSPSGQNGIGLAELYDIDGYGRTVNLSARGMVRSGDGVMIGGFVISGPAYKRMLIRAVGPTLSAFGLTDALADPVVTIYSGSKVVATNDRWENSELVAAMTAASKNAGAFALASGSEDAALFITLPPGAYTVEVKGKNGAEGIALLEIYEVP